MPRVITVGRKQTSLLSYSEQAPGSSGYGGEMGMEVGGAQGAGTCGVGRQGIAPKPWV